MKITKTQLKRIIKEEYQRVLEQPRFKTGVPEEDVLAHGLDLKKYPTTPEELESNRIAQELEDAWLAAGNPEARLGKVDGEILDMAMAIRDGDMEMEDALAQVERMSMNEEIRTLSEKWKGDPEIKQTGQYADKTKEELCAMKSTLMKKEKRTKEEQKKVDQINFAIRSKQKGPKFGKVGC
jgi:hypothetical protein